MRSAFARQVSRRRGGNRREYEIVTHTPLRDGCHWAVRVQNDNDLRMNEWMLMQLWTLIWCGKPAYHDKFLTVIIFTGSNKINPLLAFTLTVRRDSCYLPHDGGEQKPTDQIRSSMTCLHTKQNSKLRHSTERIHRLLYISVKLHIDFIYIELGLHSHHRLNSFIHQSDAAMLQSLYCFHVVSNESIASVRIKFTLSFPLRKRNTQSSPLLLCESQFGKCFAVSEVF